MTKPFAQNQPTEKIFHCPPVTMKRTFDILLGSVASAVFCIPILTLALAIKYSSPGPVFYWSDRVGKNNTLFRMPKFRTMKTNAPAVATHLLSTPELYITAIGKKLRKYSLDELPQIMSVLKGDMSFVGPRPALFNQDDLIELRTQRGIHELLPGITGWAQIHGRDDLPIPEKVELDLYYRQNHSLKLDLVIILKTFSNVFRGTGVTH
jgi:O-antigen biosynthesis protein WbqP